MQILRMGDEAMETIRRMPLIGAGITFLVSLIVSIGVIPQVATDPLATPASAIPSFWANVIANLFVGVLMVATPFVARSKARAALLWLAGIGALVLGLLLLDAAFAFQRHGLAMQGVTLALFGCVGGELVAGVLAFVAGWPRTRSSKHGSKAELTVHPRS
jgi:hypothetical protein